MKKESNIYCGSDDIHQSAFTMIIDDLCKISISVNFTSYLEVHSYEISNNISQVKFHMKCKF